MKNDTIQIEVLEDGTIKITTDKVSAANHRNADELLAFIATQTGGETIRTKRGHHHHHDHEHTHDHEHN